MSNPINIYKNTSEFINPKTPPNNFIYNLNIFFKNGKSKMFKERTENKFSKLISFNHNINFNDIERFEFNLIKMNSKDSFYRITGELTEEENIFKNNDLYIEFIKNINNMAHCCCYFKESDEFRLFVTPPNY